MNDAPSSVWVLAPAGGGIEDLEVFASLNAIEQAYPDSQRIDEWPEARGDAFRIIIEGEAYVAEQCLFHAEQPGRG